MQLNRIFKAVPFSSLRKIEVKVFLGLGIFGTGSAQIMHNDCSPPPLNHQPYLLSIAFNGKSLQRFCDPITDPGNGR